MNPTPNLKRLPPKQKRPRILFWINGLLRAASLCYLNFEIRNSNFAIECGPLRGAAFESLASYDVITLVATEFCFRSIPSHEASAISIGSVMGVLSGGIDRPSLRRLSR